MVEIFKLIYLVNISPPFLLWRDRGSYGIEVNLYRSSSRPCCSILQGIDQFLVCTFSVAVILFPAFCLFLFSLPFVVWYDLEDRFQNGDEMENKNDISVRSGSPYGLKTGTQQRGHQLCVCLSQNIECIVTSKSSALNLSYN